jgi:nucleotide-binding universal stress UspA family protein
MLKEIAVFFDTSVGGRKILEIAACLAARLRARLIGISSAAEEGGVPGSGFARGGAVREVARRRQQSEVDQLAHAGKYLAKIAARHDINMEFRIVPYSQSGGESALHALYCDLLVVGNPAVGAPLTWSAMQVLDRTGIPLLIVPKDWGGDAVGRHISMAWNASRQARRALADALPLMTAADAVDLLIVDPESDEDRHGEEPGADIACYLAHHQVPVEVRCIASQGKPVAEVLLRETAARGGDLLVFGAYSRARISEAVFGGVTRTLLDSEQVPLFISH